VEKIFCIAGGYLGRITRNGNVMIAPMSLIIASSVTPTILNGSRINHTIGKKMSISSASGQHTTSNRHHSINPMNILIPTLIQSLNHSKNIVNHGIFEVFMSP
jgi:hypothetical protein